MASRQLSFDLQSESVAIVHVGGEWIMRDGLQSFTDSDNFLQANPKLKTLIFNGRQLGHSDSAIVSYIYLWLNQAKHLNFTVEYQEMPEGLLRLLKLATSVPPTQQTPKHISTDDFFVRLGTGLQQAKAKTLDFVTFIGETLISFKNYLLGKAIFRKEDLTYFIYDCGPSSLGIVCLIAVLMGMIMAFVGAVYMVDFGVEIYVVNVVGLAMSREMAPMMTAIIMAGRTGAAFAAQLGSMQVNEEVDALKTMGVEPMDYLVLPRMLSLLIMLPLLTIFANLVGILGGAAVCFVQLDMSLFVYFEQLFNGINFRHFNIGLIKSVLFGYLIAVCGCYMGMNSGRSATAVGEATTAAVVLGIVLIVVVDAIAAILTTTLDI